MSREEHQNAVLAELRKQLARDRTKITVSGFTQLGLVELTRKRTGPSLERQLTQPCPTCNGAGRTQSPETSLLKAYRELVRLGERLRGAEVRLTLHPELAASLHQESRESLMQLARLLGARVSWIERADTPRHAVVMDLQFPGQDSASA